MTQSARFKQQDVTRLLRAARAAGFETAKIVIEPDGTLNLYAALARPDNSNEWADLE
jgi:hypothetical protein